MSNSNNEIFPTKTIQHQMDRYFKDSVDLINKIDDSELVDTQCIVAITLGVARLESYINEFIDTFNSLNDLSQRDAESLSPLEIKKALLSPISSEIPKIDSLSLAKIGIYKKFASNTKSIRDKYVDIFEIIKEGSIDQGDQVFSDFNLLISLRNHLIHYSPSLVSFEDGVASGSDDKNETKNLLNRLKTRFQPESNQWNAFMITACFRPEVADWAASVPDNFLNWYFNSINKHS